MRAPVNKKDLLYADLSYQIVGCAFDVHNELGGGLLEKVYQKAMAVALQDRELEFKEQVHYPIVFNNEKIGAGFFDFLVEKKIVVELKRTDRFSRKHIDQVHAYLNQAKLQLGILINFGRYDVRIKRVVNEL